MSIEKEISFKLEREEGYIQVTSDMDNDSDIIEIEEILAIITELLNCVTIKINKSIIKEIVKDNMTEEISEEQMTEITDKIQKETSNFVGNLIYSILNFINNKDAYIDGEDINEVSYSLAVYMKSEKTQTKEVYETFHYNNVKANEKLLGCVAFFKDTVDQLLDNNNSKEDIKQAINKSMKLIICNIYDYINKAENIKK